jgi:hypothetical protein
MHRITGYDPQFIYDDPPNEPRHTLKIAFLGAEASATYSLAQAKADGGPAWRTDGAPSAFVMSG